MDVFNGRIRDDISMITINSTTADDPESTLGTGTNDLEHDSGAHTNLYSGQVEGVFGLFGNSLNTGNIIATISGSNSDHESCVEDELFSSYDTKESVDDETSSNCDTKEKVYDETNSKCDTCLVEDESVRLCGMNTVSFDVVNHDYMYQPFCLENDFCDRPSSRLYT